MDTMAITPLRQGALRNEENFAHKTDFRGLIARFGADNLRLGRYAALFDEKYQLLDDLLEPIRKSVFTQELEDSDLFRDELVSGFFAIVKACYKHFDPTQRTAAARVDIVCDQFRGMQDMAYPAETAAIRNFIQGLEPYAAEIEGLGLAEWRDHIASANETFDSIYQSRNSEAATKAAEKVKPVRSELDKIYSKVMSLVAGFADSDGDPVFADFIREANAANTRYANLLAQRKGRNEAKKKKGEEAK